jgi:hypothetical protein
MRRRCIDSGAQILVRSSLTGRPIRDGRAWCGNCGHVVPVLVVAGIPRYSHHYMDGGPDPFFSGPR